MAARKALAAALTAAARELRRTVRMRPEGWRDDVPALCASVQVLANAVSTLRRDRRGDEGEPWESPDVSENHGFDEDVPHERDPLETRRGIGFRMARVRTDDLVPRPEPLADPLAPH